jgi:hypothetical protein
MVWLDEQASDLPGLLARRDESALVQSSLRGPLAWQPALALRALVLLAVQQKLRAQPA